MSHSDDKMENNFPHNITYLIFAQGVCLANKDE